MPERCWTTTLAPDELPFPSSPRFAIWGVVGSEFRCLPTKIAKLAGLAENTGDAGFRRRAPRAKEERYSLYRRHMRLLDPRALCTSVHKHVPVTNPSKEH